MSFLATIWLDMGQPLIPPSPFVQGPRALFPMRGVSLRGAFGAGGNPVLAFHLSFPPEDFCSIRGVLSAQAGIHPCHDVWVPASARTTEARSQQHREAGVP